MIHVKANEDEFRALVIKKVNEAPDLTVNDLVNIMEKERNVPQKITIKIVQELQSEGKISLKEEKVSHFYTNWVFWVISFSILTSLLVISDIQSIFLMIVLKYLFGTFYLFFIPGYSFTNLISRDMPIIEKIGLSFALSIAIVSLTGLFLTYTPFRLTLLTITLSLFVEIVIFSSSALYKNSRNNKTVHLPNI